MNKTNFALGAAVVAVLIAITAFFSVGGENVGGGSRFPNGLSTDSTSPSAGQVRTTTLLTTGASTLGGNVTVTTSNTATSSAYVGCYQTTATSTQTPIKFVFTTFVGSTTLPTGSAVTQGLVGWTYGSCP